MIDLFCNRENLPMCNLTFDIVDRKYDDSAKCWNLSFRADGGLYGIVGFGATIPASGWRAQSDTAEGVTFHTYWNRLILHSSGHESDMLLEVLVECYGYFACRGDESSIFYKIYQEIGQWFFVDAIDCVCVGIQSDPARIAEEPQHLKIFFTDGTEDDRYAEIFLDIDLPNGTAGLNEKDTTYRPKLVHWLATRARRLHSMH
ncbi:MAG: hypothetical protein BGN95_05640 [Sphingomonas sp. 66-10]|jgi:hypothetical protein|nr:MAG: hypothetical protein BGN95_05640 [Sphingomonas sp. 66-10]